MRTVKVIFADGNSLVTSINGTDDEIRAYYIGKEFNFGDTEAHPKDKMVKAVYVEFLDRPCGYHLTILTSRMAIDGKLMPNIIRVRDEDQALEKAKEMVANGEADAHDDHLGCMMVYPDGSVSHTEFTSSDLEF